MYNQLSSYLELNSLLNKNQFGFRSGQSTMDAINALVQDIIEAFENRDFAWASFIDLSKAFDCVDHGVLLHKMEFYGIKNAALNMFCSYLKNRRQVVEVGGRLSKVALNNCGVPQGSVLGPLLFLIAINDLPNCLNSNSYLYADDTTVMSTNNNLQTLKTMASESMKVAHEWFAANSFLLNNDKTQTVIFSLKKLEQIAESETTSSVKFLGVTLDQTLSWSEHIDQLCVRLSRLIFLFRRLSPIIPLDYQRTAYFALFQSALSYGLIFWGNSPHMSKILVLQKKVMRIMAKSNPREHCRPIFISFKIMTVINLYIFYILLFSYKNIDSCLLRADIHNLNTRNKSKINIPYVRLEKTKLSYRILGLKCLNKLPEAMLGLPIGAFKARLSNWLVKNPFYSIKEFLDLSPRAIKM